MIKVIQIIDSLNTGGAEVLAINIANLLSEESIIKSYLCVTRKEGLLKSKISKKVNYTFLNKKSTFDIKAILKLKKYIKENNISIIHAHGTSSFIAFCIKVFNPKLKIIWHDHYGNSNFLNERRKFPLSFFSRYFNAIVSVNTKLQKWALVNLKTSKNIMLNNFAYFNNEEKVTYLKGKEGRRIVCLAGFRSQKDHLTLLKAFKLILNKNPDWTLHLVGKIYDDAYSISIKNYINENNLNAFVFIYGARLDIKNILSQVTIGVLSSKSEGLPIALLEYGLAKLPVLITNVGECSKVVSNKEALVESNNYNLFSEKLNNIIKDLSLRNKLASTLNNNVIENYSKEKFINHLINIYKDLC